MISNIKNSTVFAWLFSIGMWTVMLTVNIIWFNATKDETLFVFSLVVLISTGVCIIPFTYVAYKEGKNEI